MLHRELSQNWTRPNPALHFTRAQRAEVAKRGAELNKLAAKINGYFRVVYVTQDCPELPLSVKFHLPAVRINRGAWESLDPRAFQYETVPLQTVAWYRERAVVLERDSVADKQDWSPCGGTKTFDWTDGYSGKFKIEIPAPWEPKEVARVRGAQLEPFGEFGL